MIVSFQELKDYCGISKWSQSAEDAATLILEGLQGELEAFLRRPIETDIFTETYTIQYGPSEQEGTPFYSVYAPVVGIIEYNPLGPASIPFRNSPVASITSVGRYCPTSGSVTAIEQGSGWVKQRYGMDVYDVAPGETLTVSYTAGLEWDKPGAMKFFKLLILRAATREVQNLFDNNVGKQNFEGDQQVALPIGFSDAELASTKRYRRQRI